MYKRTLSIVVLVICFIALSSMSAYAFTSIVAYGDSLSDNGNLGKLTDGDVWVDTLADRLGSTLYNKAHLGATTGIDSPPQGSTIFGVEWQIQSYQPYFSSKLDMSDTLFTVWAGANDFFSSRGFDSAAVNMGLNLQALIESGAQDILVPNLPDLGLTPAFYGQENAALASGWSKGFNQLLGLQLESLQLSNPDVNFYLLDVDAIFNDLIIMDDDGNITNQDEWLALFMPNDGVHPTSVGHEAIATGAYQIINPVPVPGALTLFCSGLIGLGALRRKFK